MSNILDYYKPRVKKAQSPTPYGTPPLFSRNPEAYVPFSPSTKQRDLLLQRRAAEQARQVSKQLQEAGKTKSISIPYEIGKSVTYSPAQVAGYFYGKDLEKVYQKARENLKKYKTPQEVGFPDWDPDRFFSPIRIHSEKENPDVGGRYYNDMLWHYIDIFQSTQKGTFKPPNFPTALSHETVHGYTSDPFRRIFKGIKYPDSKYYRYLVNPMEVDARLANAKRYAKRFGIDLDTPEKAKRFLDAFEMMEDPSRYIDGVDILKDLSETYNPDEATKFSENFWSSPGDLGDLLKTLNYIRENVPEPQRSKLLRAIYERATQLVQNNNKQRVVG